MLDQSGSIPSCCHWEHKEEYEKLIKDSMKRYVRCSYCLKMVQIVTVLGKEILERHIHDPHGASGGQNCVGSSMPIEIHEFYESELDMPKNMEEDHKAFRDIITSNKPVVIKLKEKIKNGTIFHQGGNRYRQFNEIKKPDGTRPYVERMVCGKPAIHNQDCFYGQCNGKPKSTHKVFNGSVEIMEI